jgi:hypothetical protein
MSSLEGCDSTIELLPLANTDILIVSSTNASLGVRSASVAEAASSLPPPGSIQLRDGERLYWVTRPRTARHLSTAMHMNQKTARLAIRNFSGCASVIGPIERAMSHSLNLEARAAPQVVSLLYFRGRLRRPLDYAELFPRRLSGREFADGYCQTAQAPGFPTHRPK